MSRVTDQEILRAWLSTLTASQFAELLRQRPDASRTAATTSRGFLADRLISRESVAAAITASTMAQRQVLAATSAIGGIAILDTLADVLAIATGRSAADHLRDVRDVVGQLEAKALLIPLAPGAHPNVRGKPGAAKPGPGGPPASRSRSTNWWIMPDNAAPDQPDPAGKQPEQDKRWLLNPGVHDVLPNPLGLGLPARVIVPRFTGAALQKATAKWPVKLPTRVSEIRAARLLRAA